MKRHAAMNRIFRLVWSETLNAWVCCAENTKGRGKSRSGRKLAAAMVAMATSMGMLPVAHAGPNGGQVTTGTGTISQVGANTTITQSSPNLAINWQNFNIAPNESVKFVQPSASAIALNRVLGQSPSQILGSLSANGQVFVINPNGVLFGTGAQVNVGGLVATTLNLTDADLLAGQYRFGTVATTGASGSSPASVVNQGQLNAAPGGYIALLAPRVINQGSIHADQGTALLAAGQQASR